MATCTDYWQTDGGVMDVAIQNERLMLEIKTKLAGSVTVVYLTTDGTESGSHFFSSTSCPLIEVYLQEFGAIGAFGQTGFFGPLLLSTQTNYSDQYQVNYEWDAGNTAWKLSIYTPGQLSTNEADTIGAGRTAIIYAIGEGS